MEECNITNKDLIRIIKDAHNRGRRSVYLPRSLYSEGNLKVAADLYSGMSNFKVSEINEERGKQGLEIAWEK